MRRLIPIGILLFWFLLITFGAPEEATQGWSQKIFYFHVPHAIGMYICFAAAAVFALMYLKRRDAKLDALSATALELGLVCCTIVLVTGPIWAKPIWGVYWTWEPRLTTTLFLWLIFLAALAARTAFSSMHRAKMAYALLTVIGCLDIPLVHLSVRLWRGVHPSVLRNPEGLTGSMRMYFLLSLVLMFVLLGFAFRDRFKGRTECTNQLI